MVRVGKFEKVSFKQFRSSIDEKLINIDPNIIDFDSLSKEMYDKIEIPKRATKGSAGYDFKSPFTFVLLPGETIKIPTGIRVNIEDGWWLGILPRSSMGFKYRLQLDNTMAVIDSDYYYSDNEGHIFIKITNDSKSNKSLTISCGESFAQGIFIPYGITYDDNVSDIRNGGIGSTNNS